LHDFGGCETAAVLESLGLAMADLFPAPLPAVRSGGGYAPSRSRIPAHDLLEAISAEAGVIAIIAADFLEQRSITEDGWDRLAKAVARIGAARDHAHA
jgi:hypothetical protein